MIFSDFCNDEETLLSDKWNKNSKMTAVYDTLEDIPCISMSGTNNYPTLAPNITVPTNFKVKCKIYFPLNTTNDNWALFAYKSSGNYNTALASNQQFDLNFIGRANQSYLTERNKTQNTTLTDNINLPTGEWVDLEFEYNNGEHKITIDGNILNYINNKYDTNNGFFFLKGKLNNMYLANILISEIIT
ncbi:hypothetical protein [Methanobrevibacter sp. DSM 116169]|uniref:hypothetical protein n=1 Tax=Methanobrevibacter sp. DSM 116169 TaxID=3242727 RepID=UPI0038FBF172